MWTVAHTSKSLLDSRQLFTSFHKLHQVHNGGLLQETDIVDTLNSCNRISHWGISFLAFLI